MLPDHWGACALRSLGFVVLRRCKSWVKHVDIGRFWLDLLLLLLLFCSCPEKELETHVRQRLLTYVSLSAVLLVFLPAGVVALDFSYPVNLTALQAALKLSPAIDGLTINVSKCVSPVTWDTDAQVSPGLWLLLLIGTLLCSSAPSCKVLACKQLPPKPGTLALSAFLCDRNSNYSAFSVATHVDILPYAHPLPAPAPSPSPSSHMHALAVDSYHRRLVLPPPPPLARTGGL